MKMTFVKPQLARPWVERRDYNLIATPGYTMEPKLDGHRCALIRTSNQVLLLSRTGKKMQSNPWLQEWAMESLSPGTYIDGELLATFNGASSHHVGSLRASNPDALAYVAFDCLWDAGHDLRDRPFSYRRRALCVTAINNVYSWPPDSILSPQHFYLIHSQFYTDTMPVDVRQATLDAWMAKGFEGVVFKDLSAAYAPNSRSAWIKWKQTMRAEVFIISADSSPSEWRVRPGSTGKDGVYYPDGRHTEPWLNGWTGLEYGYGPAGFLPLQFQRSLKHSGRALWHVAGSLGVTGPPDEMQRYVGKVAKVKCWGVYDTGALRHPQPEKYIDWDGKPVLPPESTLEVI